MSDPQLSIDELAAAARVLEQLAGDPGLAARLPDNVRVQLRIAAQKFLQPDRTGRREYKKARRARKRHEKRDADETVELLCTKAGEGSLALGRDVLIVKETKPLPASD